MLYVENQSVQPELEGFEANKIYIFEWFDPRNGKSTSIETIVADKSGTIALPVFPGGLTTAKTDWAAKLKMIEKETST